MNKPTQLRLIRLSQGITIKELAKKIGIAKATIIYYEQNGFVPAKHIKKYADAIHCDKETLFGFLMKAKSDEMEKGDDE